jgi:3-phosphoshikimate 1-carboxyvinyltransferase
MRQRPIQDLLDSLSQVGVAARSIDANGCPPVEICGPPGGGNSIEVNCELSSQYLSALMLVAPCVAGGLDIRVSRGPVSRPYVDITADVMQRFGVDVDRSGYERFRVAGQKNYLSGRYAVEPDASQAGYFWAAAALTRSVVTVSGFNAGSVQGDLGLIDLLEDMGCRVVKDEDGITLTGASLSAIEADMADMPDVVPTAAVVAAFADGTTRLRNVGHLAVKESNRLDAVVQELRRMGIAAEQNGQDLAITGGRPAGARIETYNDHRIAMSFAVAGLVVPGVAIQNPSCVKKSFPQFWEVFESLYRAKRVAHGA